MQGKDGGDGPIIPQAAQVGMPALPPYPHAAAEDEAEKQIAIADFSALSLEL